MSQNLLYINIQKLLATLFSNNNEIFRITSYKLLRRNIAQFVNFIADLYIMFSFYGMNLHCKT